jgi:PAS domain S-box-containing protein
MSYANDEFRNADQLIKEIKELRERGDYYKNIIESADKGIWVINNDFETVYVNYRMAEMLGYMVEEILGESVLKLIDEDNRDIFKARLSQCQKGCKERFDFRFRRKDGRELWTMAGISPFFDRQGRKIGVNGTFADITERKLMEMALQETKDELMKAQHIARVGSWVRDLKTNRFELSDELRDISGLTKEPVYLEDVLKIIHSDDRERISQTLQSAIQAYGSYKADTRIVRPDGKMLFCHLEADVVRDKWDKPVKVVGILQDITERKQAEISLREARAQSEFFIDLISHDIGNMNQAIMGYLELALDMLAPSENKKELLTKPIEIIKDSSRLINNVRKLRLAISGEIPMISMDVESALSDAIADFSHIEGRDVRINHKPKTECHVMANELLKEAFSKIIMNSLQHSSGPLTINIDLNEVLEDGKDYCRVDFEDNGPGVPDEVKEKLLKGIREAHEKNIRKGLGLHFVKTLMDAYHGKVWMEDRVPGDYSKGVRVVVLLPMAE